MNATLRKLLAITTAMVCSSAVSAADIYVDGVNGNDWNSGSKSSPVKNAWRAWSKARPGDRIMIQPTKTYSSMYFGNKSGTPSAYITIMGADPDVKTKVRGYGNFGIHVKYANYVNVTNFDVTAVATDSKTPSAIYIDRSHHNRVSWNYTHDAPCAGIQTYSTDYSTVHDNVVTNNAYNTRNWWCSGISNHENKDSDYRAGATKMWIYNNVVYGNKNVARCSTCTNSDGSGIIIDDTRRTQTDYKAYTGRTSIWNNVIWNSGGRGIHIYISDRVSVKGNTIYSSNMDPRVGSWRPGEISSITSNDISITGNTLVTDGKYTHSGSGTKVGISVQGAKSGKPGIYVDHNLVYSLNGNKSQMFYARNNGASVTFGSNNRFDDPLFVKPSLSFDADLRLLNGSPGLYAPIPRDAHTTVDIFGVPRGNGFQSSHGAYQRPF